jgi:hypothetical protein
MNSSVSLILGLSYSKFSQENKENAQEWLKVAL